MTTCDSRKGARVSPKGSKSARGKRGGALELLRAEPEGLFFPSASRGAPPQRRRGSGGSRELARARGGGGGREGRGPALPGASHLAGRRRSAALRSRRARDLRTSRFCTTARSRRTDAEIMQKGGISPIQQRTDPGKIKTRRRQLMRLMSLVLEENAKQAMKRVTQTIPIKDLRRMTI